MLLFQSKYFIYHYPKHFKILTTIFIIIQFDYLTILFVLIVV